MGRLLLALICALSASSALAQEISAEALEGAWTCEWRSERARATRAVSFDAAGRYVAESNLYAAEGGEFLSLDFLDRGDWRVEQGELIYVTASIETTAIDSSPDAADIAVQMAREAESRVGNTVRQRIIAFDGRSMTLSDGGGATNCVRR